MENRASAECRRARDARTPSTAAAVPLPRGGRSLGVENRRSVECRREIATVRCVCNAGLHHCNGQMYLQPSVTPPSPVGARIARPFIPDVIITLRAGAQRVIGATAKPLYLIDGKAAGLDRRSQRPPSREVFGVENRRFESYRRARDTRPYNVAENCNCEMCLQRWVASLQRSDVFATVGCTADPRMGAHCAPFYPRCYNNPSSGRAKGYRGDRKAPISNRRQGRRP